MQTIQNKIKSFIGCSTIVITRQSPLPFQLKLKPLQTTKQSSIKKLDLRQCEQTSWQHIVVFRDTDR
jgi:hypothetical protein